ncbi:MAG TPA: hypothetical protein PKO35_01270, partial [Candidatus Atribacteria bacterium]|nr:hypothetical protein [Candidatus Atribacteria bacterium]
IGTTYSEAPKSDELLTIWNQVAEAIRSYSWRAIYAKTDAEYNQIVSEMIQKCKDYGYDQCVEFQQNEANRLKQLMEEASK